MIRRSARRPRGNKYGNKFTVVDGIKFRSVKESRRYMELRMLEKAGEIRQLTLQPHFTLAAPVMPEAIQSFNKRDGLGGVCAFGEYHADFSYFTRDDRFIVEDCKGWRSDLYKWKARHFEAQYGQKILET